MLSQEREQDLLQRIKQRRTQLGTTIAPSVGSPDRRMAEIRGKAGIEAGDLPASAGTSPGLFERAKSSAKGLATGLIDRFKERAGTQIDAFEAVAGGEQGVLRTAGQVGGLTAGAIGDVFEEGIRGVFNLLPEERQTKIKEGTASIVEDIIQAQKSKLEKMRIEEPEKAAQTEEALNDLKLISEEIQSDPKKKRDFEALLGATELVGLGLGGRAVGAAKELVGEGAGAVARGARETVLPVIREGAEKIPQAAEAAGRGVSTVGRFATAQSTGLAPDTIELIIKNPEAFTKEAAENLTRESLFHKVKTNLEGRLDDLSTTGKEYQTLRESSQVVNFEKSPRQYLSDNFGIKFDENGAIIRTAKSTPLSRGDKSSLEEFLEVFEQPDLEFMDVDEFLNARKSLDTLSRFGAEKTDASNRVARGLRGYFDEAGKAQISGLKKLDEKFAPEIKFLNKVKGDIFKPNGELKENAISVIANLTGKGKEFKVKRFERLIPGITEEVRILKALENIEYAKGQTVGAYTRAAIGGGAVVTGNIPAAIIAIASVPSVAVKILRAYAKTKKLAKELIDRIAKKLTDGKQLTASETKIVSDAIKDNVQKSAS